MGYWVGWLVGTLVTLLVAELSDWDEPSKRQVGYTYQKLEEMKSECEKDLPRSIPCVIVVTYEPQSNALEK